MDDLQLVERMKQGDEAALTTLFNRHKVSVHRYAVHVGGRGTSADDVVQEVFLAFLRQLSQYDPSRGSVQGYLLGIARRQVFRQLGQAPPAASIDDLDDVDGAPALRSLEADPLEHLSRAEIVDQVRAAIGALAPPFREAVVLCELNELDYATAAAVMNCPIGTVRSRLHRARAALAQALAAVAGAKQSGTHQREKNAVRSHG